MNLSIPVGCAYLRHFKAKLLRLAAILFATLIAGCGGEDPAHPMSTMAPRSDLANWCYGMFMEITAWDLLILGIVIVAFILAVFVFSTRVGEAGPPTSVSSDLKLEIAWTLGPALILLFISIPTVRLIFRTQPRGPIANELPITVVAHQWWWEFHYDDGSSVMTANELHIPAERPIRLRLVSNDVIHSFWVPRLGGKRDVVPGQVNQINLISTIPGEYYGQCAEFCGLSHANMRFRIFVDKPDDFAMWEKAQAAPGARSHRRHAGEPRRASVRQQPMHDLPHHQWSFEGLCRSRPDASRRAVRRLPPEYSRTIRKNLPTGSSIPTDIKPGARDAGLRAARR